MQENTQRCGWVAIIGRPNVGKSTLFNALLGRSVSIVTRKAQTTQSKIMGVVTTPPHQYIMLDTPGVQERLKRRGFAKLNKVAKQAAYEADVAVFMVEGLKWREDDTIALDTLADFKGPCIALINKYDRFVNEQEKIARYVEILQSRREFDQVILVSCERGIHTALVHEAICERIPEGEFAYDSTMLTHHSEDFILAEILRSKLLLLLHEEVPYQCYTDIEHKQEQAKHWVIHANIWVPTSAKKALVIGKGGSKLKQIGEQARSAMRAYLDKEVVLKTWVKIGTPQHED